MDCVLSVICSLVAICVLARCGHSSSESPSESAPIPHESTASEFKSSKYIQEIDAACSKFIDNCSRNNVDATYVLCDPELWSRDCLELIFTLYGGYFSSVTSSRILERSPRNDAVFVTVDLCYKAEQPRQFLIVVVNRNGNWLVQRFDFMAVTVPVEAVFARLMERAGSFTEAWLVARKTDLAAKMLDANCISESEFMVLTRSVYSDFKNDRFERVISYVFGGVFRVDSADTEGSCQRLAVKMVVHVALNDGTEVRVELVFGLSSDKSWKIMRCVV